MWRGWVAAGSVSRNNSLWRNDIRDSARYVVSWWGSQKGCVINEEMHCPISTKFDKVLSFVTTLKEKNIETGAGVRFFKNND